MIFHQVRVKSISSNYESSYLTPNFQSTLKEIAYYISCGITMAKFKFKLKIQTVLKNNVKIHKKQALSSWLYS